jgi:two-component system, chemotaxis family, sensor kinase CheA
MMDDLLRDFLMESAENLGRLDNDLVDLERRPDDPTPLHSVFRTIHTIKGTCGFLGLSRLELLAHSAESVLDALRGGRLHVRDSLISDVLASVDRIKHILDVLEQTEAEPEGTDADIIARLDAWLEAAGGSSRHTPFEATVAIAAAPVDTLEDAAPATVSGPPATPASIESDATTPAPDAPDAASDHRSHLADSTLRVGVGLLDELMNLVGELALSRNQLIQLAGANEQSEFVNPVQHLNRVTTDLLDAVLRTRMQPIGNAWTKLPRVVRDLAAASGKQIALSMHGADTELDRQILQAIQDPLTHMIRNSADHGVETPVERRASGKADGGTIRLVARHEGGHVIIEISDDGRGIDVGRVRQKAIERGLVRADAAASLNDTQVLRFIFEPGFSTADKITNVSGRGVGMDVVRSNIESIGGSVELQSEHGRGTTVRIRIPLTLAIISALLVGTAGETFAVPQIGIVELVRVTEEQRHLVELVHGAQFYRLRDSLLPLVPLHALLGLEATTLSETSSIVVCQVGDTRFGLVVDEVFDTAEIVVKPIGRLVKHLQAYAGCTITGDGRVIMILDPAGVASMATISSRSTADRDAQADADAARRTADDATESVLLFDAGYEALQAVPLAVVARLEEFAADAFEHADGQYLVQYRGSLMPILPANPAMQLTAVPSRPVIVFSDGERTIGLAVDAIRDIVEDQLRIERRAQRPGVLGVCVIDGRATEVIDTDHFLRTAFPDWHRHIPAGDAARPPHVLVVDDSRFFLGLLAPALRTAGFSVSTATSGDAALARLDAGERVDVLVSDIEMAGLDGFSLARAIRARPQHRAVRLVALTTRTSAEDRSLGLSAGFDQYLPKYDRDTVVATVQSLLAPEQAAA